MLLHSSIFPTLCSPDWGRGSTSWGLATGRLKGPGSHLDQGPNQTGTEPQPEEKACANTVPRSRERWVPNPGETVRTTWDHDSPAPQAPQASELEVSVARNPRNPLSRHPGGHFPARSWFQKRPGPLPQGIFQLSILAWCLAQQGGGPVFPVFLFSEGH